MKPGLVSAPRGPQSAMILVEHDGVQLQLSGPPLRALTSRDGKHWEPAVPDLDFDAMARGLVDPFQLSEALRWDGIDFDNAFDLIERLTTFRRFIVKPMLFAEIARFGGLHFTLAFWSQRSDSFGELLLQTNPGLAFALAVTAHPLDPDGTPERIEQWSRRRQPILARELGFVEGAWRVLSKLTPESLDTTRLDRLRQRLTDPQVLRLAQHLHGELTPEVVEILLDPQLLALVSPRLLQRLAYKSEFGTVRVLKRLRTLWDVVGVAKTRHFDTSESLTEALEGVQERLQIDFGDLPQLLTAKFHQPLKGEPDLIEPITTGRELIVEAYEQLNCVASPRYVHHLLFPQGSAAIYRVLPRWGMERATLMLAKQRRWKLVEISGPRNQKVRASTLRGVLVWLADRQGVRNIQTLNALRPSDPMDDEV